MNRSIPRILTLSVVLLAQTQAVAGTTNFDDITAGSSFTPTEMFASGGATLSVLDGPGAAHILASGDFGAPVGSGNELIVNNVTIDFDFGSPLQSLKFTFGFFGGDALLRLNDLELDGSDLEDLLALPPADFPVNLGDLLLSLSFDDVQGGIIGMIEVTGPIDTFQIYGQELVVDDFEYVAIPETSSLALLFLAASGVGIAANHRFRRQTLNGNNRPPSDLQETDR